MNTGSATVEEQKILDVFEKQKRRSLLLRSESIAERKKRLRAFEVFLLRNRSRVSDAVFKDFKKPQTESDMAEVYPVLTEIRHTLAKLDDWARPQKIDAPVTYLGTRAQVMYEPKGVCLIIAPWNFPFNLCFGPLVSCIAAGNTAILKPSELTPHTSKLIAELVAEFFEDELVTVIEGALDVSAQLLSLPFDHIFFTGSPAVGKIVMKAAAENLASVTLELGGKSPAIVDESADLSDAARRIAFGKFLNNGQTCIAPDYVLVHESVQSKFIDELKSIAVRLFGEKGSISESSPNYARVVNRKHFDRLNRILQDAVEKGAKVEMSGPVNKDSNFIHPVILSNVASHALAMQDEIFGPVLPVVTFRSVEQVTDLINEKPKPLALYIFSRRRSFQQEILSRTSAGSVGVNDCVLQFSHPNLPFGGVNNSGIGKSHGRYGFIAFSNEKPVLRQRRGFSMAYLIHPPYTDFRKRLVNLMLRWF
ncbi:MAG TPA: aldehyde dehydrogenase family protein [Cyclobacteriaceae bacterium]|nr:aldehyde dehydrogenase family protein [Cyclobacteriaceae bacterium]